MKQEYDFSDGVRGKFFHPEATFDLPVYLDEEVRTYLQAQAESKGVELARLVNDILKQDIKLLEVFKP